MHHEPDSLLALFGASSPPTYVSSEGTSTYSFRKASHIRFFSGPIIVFVSPDLGSYRPSLSFDLFLPCAVCFETKPEITPGAYSHLMRGEGLGSHASCQVTAVCLFENI